MEGAVSLLPAPAPPIGLPTVPEKPGRLDLEDSGTGSIGLVSQPAPVLSCLRASCGCCPRSSASSSPLPPKSAAEATVIGTTLFEKIALQPARPRPAVLAAAVHLVWQGFIAGPARVAPGPCCFVVSRLREGVPGTSLGFLADLRGGAGEGAEACTEGGAGGLGSSVRCGTKAGAVGSSRIKDEREWEGVSE